MKHNHCNCAASSTLISPDAIIFSRDLTGSSVVLVYFCRSLTCGLLGALDIFALITYDSTDLGSPEGSTEGTIYGSLDELLRGA